MIMVAQRVASIVDADQIIVLDAGSIVGRGRHAELLETCPTYVEIVTSQREEAAASSSRARTPSSWPRAAPTTPCTTRSSRRRGRASTPDVAPRCPGRKIARGVLGGHQAND